MSNDHNKGAAMMTLGLVIQLLAYRFVPRELDMVRQGIGFVAGGLLVFGGARTSASKGYSPWLGLLGILSFVGMGIILLLPDKQTLVPQRKTIDQADEEKEDTEPA